MYPYTFSPVSFPYLPVCILSLRKAVTARLVSLKKVISIDPC